MKNYIYLEHPVDKQEVRALNSKGFKVLDVKFAPADAIAKVVEEAPKPAATKRKPRAKK